jgi:hypothetical protein
MAVRRQVWQEMTPEQRRRLVRLAACEFIAWLMDQPEGRPDGRVQLAQTN